MEFYEVVRDYEVLLVVVLCEVGILYLLVHDNLLCSRSLHKVIKSSI